MITQLSIDRKRHLRSNVGMTHMEINFILSNNLMGKQRITLWKIEKFMFCFVSFMVFPYRYGWVIDKFLFGKGLVLSVFHLVSRKKFLFILILAYSWITCHLTWHQKAIITLNLTKLFSIFWVSCCLPRTNHKLRLICLKLFFEVLLSFW